MCDLLNEAECIVVEVEIKDILNKGFKVCCPDCHSTNYEIYPTGQLSLTIQRPEEDVHWVCKDCGYIWNSEVVGQRYNFQKSCLTGKFHPRYQKKRGLWWKVKNWLRRR